MHVFLLFDSISFVRLSISNEINAEKRIDENSTKTNETEERVELTISHFNVFPFIHVCRIIRISTESVNVVTVANVMTADPSLDKCRVVQTDFVFFCRSCSLSHDAVNKIILCSPRHVLPIVQYVKFKHRFIKQLSSLMNVFRPRPGMLCMHQSRG